MPRQCFPLVPLHVSLLSDTVAISRLSHILCTSWTSCNLCWSNTPPTNLPTLFPHAEYKQQQPIQIYVKQRKQQLFHLPFQKCVILMKSKLWTLKTPTTLSVPSPTATSHQKSKKFRSLPQVHLYQRSDAPLQVYLLLPYKHQTSTNRNFSPGLIASIYFTYILPWNCDVQKLYPSKTSNINSTVQKLLLSSDRWQHTQLQSENQQLNAKWQCGDNLPLLLLHQ